MSVPDAILGKDCVAYYGASTDPIGSMVEMGNITNVKVNAKRDTADTTRRSNAGWKSKRATLAELQISFETMIDLSDAAYTALRSAFLNNTLIGFAALTAAYGVTGAEGPIGAWSVSEFTRDEPLGEAVKVSVTLDLYSLTDYLGD